MLTEAPAKRPSSRRGSGGNSGQGMNWISQTTRLAIYIRDGLRCVYCTRTTVDGISLTLDHVVPRSRGGTNAPTNLVTACNGCNASRCDRPISPVARYRIRRNRRRVLKREQARRLISDHGTCSAAVKSVSALAAIVLKFLLP